MKICTFKDCGRKRVAHGLCGQHRKQQRAGKELTPLKVYKKYAVPAPGKKICSRCERVLDAERDFYKRPEGTPRAYCKRCIQEQNDKRAAERAKERENNNA